MAKPSSKDELVQHKDASLQTADDFISKLIRSDDPDQMKRASLLSYWIADYFHFLEKEEVFDPKKCIKYNRGDIVKIHLGFRIGSEEGGQHYAVVIDNNNSKRNNTLTVIPLTSIREGRKIHHSSVEIGNEIFSKIMSKHDKLENKIADKLRKLDENVDKARKNGAATANLKSLISQVEELQRRAHELQSLKKEILKMKSGSVALVNQITTVSKIRIRDPLYTYNVLYGIRLSPTTLDKINEKIKDLYIF